jgi:hypothetical protein
MTVNWREDALEGPCRWMLADEVRGAAWVVVRVAPGEKFGVRCAPVGKLGDR